MTSHEARDKAARAARIAGTEDAWLLEQSRLDAADDRDGRERPGWDDEWLDRGPRWKRAAAAPTPEGQKG